MFAVYLSVSSHSSLSVDPGTVAVPETDAPPEIDYAPDDQTFAAELPGKHPPFEHADIAYSFSLMLALEIVVVTAFLYLMHSLFL
jgi:hypothetical protein